MISIVNYQDKYKTAFKTLNENWINKFFVLEPADIETLNHPEQIIDNGGFIFVALHQDEPVGVCALKKITSERYELSKFAVAENTQGLGIGKRLIETCIATAKQHQIKMLFLEGNTKLEASIHLYRKYGFKELDLSSHDSSYERVNIVMELTV
ncbi:GNAT family N-acetyltransferase [Pedobacter montanisoli]|uniref:GNAT family N-acetyltransferase n=1 Tax=Pedobacter montanisoli TaxID=2923277 RepID=A0ABS9ZRZ8_9SPHI|nr:GNAT family N-acetyltransferase [Pedobacter montanisoli]MCJ0741356.1 GNAT family N-acetyltransferase [Pedobacter montanisoli]